MKTTMKQEKSHECSSVQIQCSSKSRLTWWKLRADHLFPEVWIHLPPRFVALNQTFCCESPEGACEVGYIEAGMVEQARCWTFEVIQSLDEEEEK